MLPAPSPPSCIAAAQGARESRNKTKQTQKAVRARPPPRQKDIKPSASAHRGSTAKMKARATPKNTSTQRKKRQWAMEGTRGRAARASHNKRGRGGGAATCARAAARLLETVGAETGDKAADGGGRSSIFEAVADGGATAVGGGAGA